MTDSTLETIAGFLPNLVSLYLEECTNISGNPLVTMVRKCPMLSSVTIVFCVRVTDDWFTILAEKWTRLESLDVQNSYISDASVLAIYHHCKNLRRLHFEFTSRISAGLETRLPLMFAGVVFESTNLAP